jgi:glycosyl hydrolase family 113
MAASRRTSLAAIACAVLAGGGAAAYAIGTRPAAPGGEDQSLPLPGNVDPRPESPTPTPTPTPTTQPHAAAEPAGAGEKQRGVALGMFAEDVSFSYASQLAELVALGATHVSLIVPIYQTDVRSADLGLHTRFSPTLSLLADTVRLARRDRLEVTVFPILRLRTAKPGEWRGTLAPSNPTEWFRRYADLLGDLAAVANLTGASRFVVGSELSSLDGDVERWKPMLERIRAVFKGTLVYSANWDHFREAKLLDLVDEDGVTGYFNLRADDHAPSDEPALEEGWRRVKQELDAWHALRRHPLVLTELGYRSRAGCTASPWDEGAGGTVDLDEQRRAFEAFRRVWAASPLLDGVYVWNWYGFGGPASISYTPRGKPAEAEVKRLLQDL